MEIKKKHFEKYLHDIAVEQIAEEYMHKGYEILKEAPLAELKADLIVKKGGETVVIEVQSGKITADKKEKIKHLGNYIRSLSNYKFHVAIATPPNEKKLEIPDLENLLIQEMINNLPDEIDELSSHSRIEEISDVDIDEIIMDGKSILVKGDGVISVEMQYGSDSDQNKDDGHKTDDNFPFGFNVILEYNDRKELEIVESKIEVDTSSYYG